MCDGIGVTRPTFHWDWALGPTRGQTRGETEINRTEVLISGSGCFWYGKIKEGELYAADARPWRRLWLRVLSGRSLSREQQIEFNNARVLTRQHVREMVRGTRTRRNVLLAGRQYRFWVDYWLFEEAGDNVGVVDPVEHHNGSATWNPPVPPRTGWQTRTIPRGENPRVVLDCRRYAFLPRLKDLISNHRTMQDTLARHLSGLGLARTYLECLRRLVGFSFDDNVVLNPSHTRWESAGRHYAQLGYVLSQMDAYSQAYLIEQRTSQLIIWHLNRYARKIFHTLRHNRVFLQDISTRERGDQNSDEIRDLIAQAQLVVVNTPPPLSARDIPEGEIVYNDPRTAIRGFSCRPPPNYYLIMERRGQPPLARGYFTGPAWRDRYFRDIYRPFMQAASAPQGLSTAVARLSPLFAARENLTFITNAVVVPGSRQFDSYARMSHSVMRQYGLIRPGWDFDRVQRHIRAGNNVNDFARSRGGSTGILLTTGLTFMWKGVVLAQRWQTASASGRNRDYVHVAQATVDFASATTDVTNSVLVSINRGSRAVRAGTAAGGALSVLSDGLDTGLFIYDEFNAEARARNEQRYGDDFVDREVAYNCVIAGGKVVSTVGSALMTTTLLAPVGILVKAIGLGISNLTEFAREMDRLGEEEQELCRMIWRRMNADCADFRSYYNRMIRTYRRPYPWTHVQAQFDNLERGIGDHWVSISSDHIRAVRMAFNRRDHRG